MRTLPLIALLLPALAIALRAQDAGTSDHVAPRTLVIVASTTSFAEAKRAAVDAARRLGRRAEIDERSPNAESGLTFTAAECDANGWSFPCNVPRGRADDEQVTIEHTLSYPELRPGLYIVVVASGTPGSERMRSHLASARAVYPDAYARDVEVYLGCMH